MAQKRRRKCISHLIYFQFCLDVRIASECNRMQGKSRSAKWMEVVVSSYPHPTQCHHRHLTSFQHLFNSKEKALLPNTVNINVHYRGRCHNCRTLLFTARELRRGSCVQAAAGGQTFQRHGSAQCRQMSWRPTKQRMSPGMWRCEPISYVHCVPELNFSIVITWTKVSLFLFCTEVRTLYLSLHTTHSLAKWNRKEVSKVSTVCRLRSLTSVFITELCSPHHWPIEVTTKVREDFIQSWRCPLLGPSLLSHLRHYAKFALTNSKLTWHWDTLRI